MTNPTLTQLQTWLTARQPQLLADCRRLLQIPSVQDKATPGAPYGAANRQALDMMLAMARERGWRTKDLDGYCGWAEFGSGDAMIMTLGHIDVVPVEPGWRHAPWGAEVDDGYLYGRGAIDDKGPTMASFYAAMALHAILPEPGVRVRCVFGCNEETGFGCIARYNRTEEVPTYGIAPDSSWPLVHAEKGIANLIVDAPRPGAGLFELLELEGGKRANIVIPRCTARIRVAPSVRPAIEATLADAWDKNITATWDGDVLHLDALGKAAHGAMPYYGDNAATRVLRLLMELAPLPVKKAYSDLFCLPDHSGAGLGAAGSDEVSGPLTCNLGVVRTRGDAIRLTLNLRYPVTWDGAALRKRCEARLAAYDQNYTVVQMGNSRPLYFPTDHPLVKTICEVHAAETGEQLKPGTTGGGTYARAIANTVSVGTGWIGDGPAHENDERVKIDHLYTMSRIYAHILYRLTQVAQA